MQLETYISDLLYRYDCVVVPNFGGFVTNRRSVQINGNTFSPPYKQITFNTLLQNNDGLLANYIAQVDKMPYETAVNYVNFKVQEWIDKLLDEELDLEGLGTLYVANDKIQFEPENKVNYLTSAYGLSKFASDEMVREEQVEKTEVKVIPILEDKRKMYKEQAHAVEEKAPVYITPEKRRKTPNFIKYAAIFILGASIIGVGSKIYKDNQEQKQITALKKQQKEYETKIQEATFVIEAPLPTITLDSFVKKEKYHIIAGAFRSESNAAKKVQQLVDQGFEAKIVGKNKWGLTQVAFASFTSLERADATLTEIKSAIAKDAWLLVREN